MTCTVKHCAMEAHGVTTMKVCATEVAELKVGLPDCVAVTVTVPGPVRVRVVPDKVAGPET